MPSPHPDVPDAAHAFLAGPLPAALLRTHPNALAIPPALHFPDDLHYTALLHAYRPETPDATPALPADIAALIADIRRLELPRTPIALPDAPLPLPATGMSPKKAHEVARMASYVAALVRVNRLPSDLRIVDVGAGQGYLTRALKALLPEARILALDADDNQTRGAQRWEARLLPAASPPIDHRTVLLGEDGALLSVVDEWVRGDSDNEARISEGDRKAPVLFVALHACGSLTPDVLRAFIAASTSPSPPAHWTPAGVVAVGCCYNLMNPSDFPLSRRLLALPPLALPPAAFHLAAQIPGTWLVAGPGTERTIAPGPKLAIRKVAWRALLERELAGAGAATVAVQHSPTAALEDGNLAKNQSATVPARWPRKPAFPPTLSPSSSPSCPSSSSSSFPPLLPSSSPHDHLDPASGIGATPALRRLGRLRDAAYGSWARFRAEAGERVGLELGVGGGASPPQSGDGGAQGDGGGGDEGEGTGHPDSAAERTLETLHVLRCLLGPVVESAVLRDRAAWVAEELEYGRHTSSRDDATITKTTTTTDKDQAADRDAKTKPAMRVALVSLFDQATGSGRNVALVVAPVVPYADTTEEG